MEGFLTLIFLAVIGLLIYGCVIDYKKNKNNTHSTPNYKNEILKIEYQKALRKMSGDLRALFDKYGVAISYNKMIHISNACEKAKSEEDIVSIIFSFIPDNIPTIESVNVYSTGHANNILNLCSNIELKNYLKERFEENIAVITENDLNNIYHAQKSSQVPGQENIFRFNFELFAFTIIFHELDDISPFLFSQTELDVFKEVLLRFGNDNGYSLNTPVLLNETITHFKDFFRKYGVTISPEEVAHIMTQYAMAAEKGSPESVLYSFIPDEIPSQNKFVNEITYQLNHLLSLCPNEAIKQRLHNEWNSTIDEFTSFAILGLYETQKLTVPEEDQHLFRFNYELNAIIMLLTYCEDISEEATEDEENTINAFTDALLKYANSAGYSALN